MGTTFTAGDVLRLVEVLTTLGLRCYSVALTPSRSCRVHGEDPSVLSNALRLQLDLIQSLSERYPELKEMNRTAKYWAEYLARSYDYHDNLTVEDAKRLHKDADTWVDSIINTFENVQVG